jgi:hypothetical protein
MTHPNVEATILRLNTDPNPPAALGRVLWCSRPQAKRTNARTLAAMAAKHMRSRASYPKAKATRLETESGQWRGIVYAGRRTRRETETQRSQAPCKSEHRQN